MSASCVAGCDHFMLSRCPACGREMYASAVYAFSHGETGCLCGHVATPQVIPAHRAPDNVRYRVVKHGSRFTIEDAAEPNNPTRIYATRELAETACARKNAKKR